MYRFVSQLYTQIFSHVVARLTKDLDLVYVYNTYKNKINRVFNIIFNWAILYCYQSKI